MNLTGQVVWKDGRGYRRTVRNVEHKMFGMTGEVRIGGKKYLATKGNESYSQWQASHEIKRGE